MIRSLWASLCRATLLVAIGLFVFGIVAVLIRFPWIGVLLVVAIALRHSRRRWGGDGWSYGSARFCTTGELARAGMLGEEGLILGRVSATERPSRWSALFGLLSPGIRAETAVGRFLAAFFNSGWMSDRIIRVRDYVHLATFSRTGGGKGVSVVIPNLLSYRQSVVVMDPKCENFNLTADFRRKRFGHRIIRLDPALLGKAGADSFNPLAFIDAAAPDFLDTCRDVAAMLIKRQGTEPDPFWNDAAELVLTAQIAFVCACEPNENAKNLQTVRKIVASRERFAGSINVMRQTDNEVIRQLGNQLTWLADKELNGVLSSVGRHTAWLDSPAVAASMTTNSFDPTSLRSGKVSVFLVMPPERLAGTWSPLMRLWLGSILRIVSRQGADERREILFLSDEVAQLGRMQALEDATTIMRGYGIRIWYIFQSLQQVYACYGDKADVLLDNIATQQFFAVTSTKTAEEISKRLGDHTIAMTTYNDNRSESTQTGSGQTPRTSSHSSSSGSNTSQLGRRVLKPEEILTLSEDTALIAHRNMSFIPARLLKYYSAPEFKGRGTGKRRGLGLGAGIAAVVMLLVSGIFAKFTNELPMPVTQWRPRVPGAYAGWLQQGYGTSSPASDEYFGFPELEPVQYRRNQPSIFPELDPIYYIPGR